MLPQLVVDYGPEVAAIATLSIFFVGVVKFAFRKQLDTIGQNKRKAIYEALSSLISFIATAVWLVLEMAFMGTAFDWAVLVKEGLAAYSATKVGYALYENLGLRELFRLAVKGAVQFAQNDKKKEEPKEGNDNIINL